MQGVGSFVLITITGVMVEGGGVVKLREGGREGYGGRESKSGGEKGGGREWKRGRKKGDRRDGGGGRGEKGGWSEVVEVEERGGRKEVQVRW